MIVAHLDGILYHQISLGMSKNTSESILVKLRLKPLGLVGANARDLNRLVAHIGYFFQRFRKILKSRALLSECIKLYSYFHIRSPLLNL